MDNHDSPDQMLQGKVCLVTGATSGIGLVTATALAALGAIVVAVGRDQVKLHNTIQQIITRTGNKDVHSLQADFADLDQVRELSLRFKQQYIRLDILVNNAGAFFNRRRVTPYGMEMTFLVNHLAPYLLTNLLLDTMKNSAPSRIINVSSDAHQYGEIDFTDLTYKHFYFGMWAYARSKLANVLFTYELARRMEGRGITVNALHPGHVATNIWSADFPIIGPVLYWFMKQIALTPEQGADNTIYLATSPNVEGITGKYFVGRSAVSSSIRSYDEVLAKNLWEFSKRAV
jgi:NAD(P)-dependent dehydrogenase (short-subunit alcohol dehydrogenase family)